MKSLTKLVILFSIALSVSCKKEDPEPVPPIIKFISAQLSTDKSHSIVRFEFFDGDGDLGLAQEETTGEQEYNLYVDYYEKINGTWVLKSPLIKWNPDITLPLGGYYDTSVFHLRIPLLENDLKRSLEGETQVNLFYNNFILPVADTFRYDITLKDRAFHSSNVITTTDLIVN